MIYNTFSAKAKKGIFNLFLSFFALFLFVLCKNKELAQRQKVILIWQQLKH